EDGIRDFHVTGVQTCALPILPDSLEELMSRVKAKHPERIAAGEAAMGAPIEAFFLFAGLEGYTVRAIRAHELARDAIKAAAPHRSEERRVGKECGPRRWRGQ